MRIIEMLLANPSITLYLTPDEWREARKVLDEGWYDFRAISFKKSETAGEVVMTVVGKGPR